MIKRSVICDVCKKSKRGVPVFLVTVEKRATRSRRSRRRWNPFEQCAELDVCGTCATKPILVSDLKKSAHGRDPLDDAGTPLDAEAQPLRKRKRRAR